MAEMSNYCKAYAADELRRFPDWFEMVPPLTVRREEDAENPETSNANNEETQYFFVHEDFTVTAGIFKDQNITFDRVTESWKEFCTKVLGFQSPSLAASSPKPADCPAQ